MATRAPAAMRCSPATGALGGGGAIKNLRAVEGMRFTYGCSLMSERVAGYDHNVTRRLKDAGFIVVGTTTLPEYGILPTSEARLFGATRNPWDLERTPGGLLRRLGRGGRRGHGAGRTAATGAARFAFPRRVAAWWG